MKQAKLLCRQQKNTQVQDQKKKKKKGKLHTQAYTVEMGKCTKINKKVKNKLQRKMNRWTIPM